MIDFHSHLLPGVDDGAADLEQSRAALAAMVEQGVRVVVTTPHIRATLANDAASLRARLDEVDAAWATFAAMAAAEFPDVRIERGHEVMLDTPEPDLGEPALRLAGTSFVLLEFPSMMIPPNSVNALFELKMKGWQAVIAHPERYGNLAADLAIAGEWRRVGAYLQINAGSVLGRYGESARAAVRGLLARGWADYLCSDYHARGECRLAAGRAEIERLGGAEQARLLCETNAARLLAGQPPLAVPPLTRPSLLARLFRGRA